MTEIVVCSRVACEQFVLGLAEAKREFQWLAEPATCDRAVYLLTVGVASLYLELLFEGATEENGPLMIAGVALQLAEWKISAPFDVFDLFKTIKLVAGEDPDEEECPPWEPIGGWIAMNFFEVPIDLKNQVAELFGSFAGHLLSGYCWIESSEE